MKRIAVLAALAVLLLGLPSALASHTPPPTAVTIAGSLQSELGCPGDFGSSGTQAVNDAVANWRNVAPCGN